MSEHTDDHTGTVEYAIASGGKKLDDASAQTTSRWVETCIRDEDDARWGDVEMGRYPGSGVLGIHAPPPQKP